MCRYNSALSSESYVRANSRFIKMTNLPIAVYTELLCKILTAVEKKKTFNPETGLFLVDRKYVEDCTGIIPDDQREYDKALNRLGIVSMIDEKNSNKISLDVKAYYDLLITADESAETSILPKTYMQTRSEKSKNRTEGIKLGILAMFGELDEQSSKAIYNVIDVYYSKGLCKHASWQPIVDRMSKFKDSPAEYVAVCNDVLAKNWKSPATAIDEYSKNHVNSAVRLNSPQPQVTKLDSTISF